MLTVRSTRTRGTSLSSFYSLNHKQIKTSGHKVTKANQEISCILYCLSNVTSRHLQTPPVLPKGGKPGPRLTRLTVEDWEPGYGGLLESRWGEMSGLLFQPTVDILTLVISFPGAEATSLL